MTKTKNTNQNLSFTELILAPFKPKTLIKGFNKKNPTIYAIIIAILITIISLLKNNIENYSPLSLTNTTVIYYNTIGLALLCFGLYTIFYIFINAYQQQSSSYLEGLLVGTTIFLPTLFIGNLLDYIGQLIANPILASIIIFIIMIIVIYSLISYIITLKNFQQTTYPKIIASILQAFILFTVILMSGYIVQLVSIMV